MPRITGNPSKMFNVAYAEEIVRIARVTSTNTVVINNCSTLISRMINKEGNGNTTGNVKNLSKTFGRHIQTFSKLFAKSLEFLESICTKNLIDLIVLTWTDYKLPFRFYSQLTVTQTLGFVEADSLSVRHVLNMYNATVRSQVPGLKRG